MPHTTNEPAAPAVKLVTEALDKPSLDNRSYRVIELGNGLEALLVHDSETDKASASLDVGVGNFSDDNDMPGTAHAVEHVSDAAPIVPSATRVKLTRVSV
jgi:insulysin